MTDTVKISANLSREVVEALKAIADRLGITKTEALRRAISTEKFLMDVTDDDGKILVEDKNKNIRELLLR